jgi:protein-disulfide isomerase
MPNRNRFETATTALLTLCALVVTILVVRREFMAPPSPSPRAPTRYISNWRDYVVGDERIGPDSARVTLVEFSDFQCPYCREFAEVLDTVRAKYGTSVLIVHRNFPLTRIHPLAKIAALAGECAAAQGRFEAFHDYVFRHQDSLHAFDWPALGSRVAVADTAAFASCVRESGTAEIVKRDSIAGETLHIDGTPTILLGNVLYAVRPTAAEILQTIKADLDKSH